MVDLTQTDKALAETFAANPVEVISPVKIAPVPDPKNIQKSLAPVVPDIKFDTSIPQEVKNSMDAAESLGKKNRFDERARTEDLINTIRNSQTVTTEAQGNIAESQNHMFGEIIGIWDEKFSVPKQQKKILKAQRDVQTKIQIGKLENFQDQLEMQDASAEYTEYLHRLSLQQKNLGISTAMMNSIIQSNAAKKSLQNFEFAKASVDELNRRKQTKDFDETFTEQRINAYFNKVDKAQLDIDASRLAFKSSQLKLGQDLETRALENLPLNFLRQKLQESIDGNLGFVQLGKDFKLAQSKVQKIISEKETIATKQREQEASRAVKLAQNNAEFNTVQSDMNMLSRDFYGGQGQRLNRFNMLNVTDETLAEINFDSLHPGAASEYLALQQFTANMNGKTNVTQQDMATQKQLTANLQTKLDVIKKNEMDAQPDKLSKSALQEWYNNGGRMKTGQNSANVTAANISSMPDFGGDNALEIAYSGLQSNMLEDLRGTTVNIQDEKGDLDANAFLQAALSEKLRGKQTNSQVILRNITKINANGQSPLSLYTNTKSAEVVLQAVRNLANVNSEVKAALLDGNGNPTSAWVVGGGQNHVNLANELARISGEILKLDSSAEPNALNFALQLEINNVISENAEQWGSQLNQESGSFMVNLFNNRQPFRLVDAAINASWAQHVNASWQNLVEQSKKQERIGELKPPFERMGGQ